MLFINFLQDAAPAAGGGGMQLIIMLVLMFAIMYFFMIRPQKKRQKEIQEFRNKLDIGSKIVTSGERPSITRRFISLGILISNERVPATK